MIAIFGANGMLGNYISTYLKRLGMSVKDITRNDINVADFDEYEKINSLIEQCDTVINCAGTIKPVASKQSKPTTFMVNSIFPHYLSRACKIANKKFIHITTDCVYTGNSQTPYDETSYPDAIDDYGMSKSIGDLCYGVVLRTSIIGEEKHNNRSLLEWAKSQKGKEVNGFTNHHWSGVTCLELAKIIGKYLDGSPLFQEGITHVYSLPVNKAELLRYISNSFNLNLTVKEVEANYCNRTIVSSKPKYYTSPNIPQQLEELVGFYERN